ncbi:MAG: SAM-dependent chlorinase/fluorinase [Bryobacteraceae bacterium]
MKTSRTAPIITLTTDFGLSNHYVGVMKGVILGICPAAQIVDITHEIPAYNILAGAYAIQQATGFFPAETTHIVVVDPGVGTSRRGLLVDSHDQFFIAPDNGVLSFILSRDPTALIREITNADLWLKRVSATFHGRDIFAPVAAALAAGKVKPKDAGARVEAPILLESTQPHETHPAGTWHGTVLSTDRFGNIITNFPQESFAALPERAFEIDLGTGVARRKTQRFRTTFGDAKPSELFAYFGSSGFIELAINQASAAARLSVSAGSPVTLRWTSRG